MSGAIRSRPGRSGPIRRFLRGYQAAFVLPFVLALDYSTPLFFVLLVSGQALWLCGGKWTAYVGSCLSVGALLVAALALGASLERGRTVGKLDP